MNDHEETPPIEEAPARLEDTQSPPLAEVAAPPLEDNHAPPEEPAHEEMHATLTGEAKPTDEPSLRQLIARRIANASERNITIQVILIISSFAGLCGSIFPILKSMYFSDYTAYLATATTTLFISILLLAFFFTPKWKAYLLKATIFLWFVISLTLCGLLYWKYFVAVDRWVVWTDTITEKINNCEAAYKTAQFKDDKKASNATDKIKCVGDVIKNNQYPIDETGSKLQVVAIENDIRAGTILMKNDVVREVLNKKFGIDEKFLGTGFAIPSGENRHLVDAFLPEYLVPNAPETDPGILTWQLKLKTPADWLVNVECVIIGCSKNATVVNPAVPSNIKLPDANADPATISEEAASHKNKYEGLISYIRDSQNQFAENRIVFVRFSQFNPVDLKTKEIRYKGNLGRDDASQVFMVRLRDVWNMSLKDAAVFSGRRVSDSNAETFFIWIYAPDKENTTRATWRNVIYKMEDLLKDNLSR